MALRIFRVDLATSQALTRPTRKICQTFSVTGSTPFTPRLGHYLQESFVIFHHSCQKLMVFRGLLSSSIWMTWGVCVARTVESGAPCKDQPITNFIILEDS